MKKNVYLCRMISKSKQKEISSYKLQKNCDSEQVFVVEGPKMCSEAWREKITIRIVVALPEWLEEVQQEWGFDWNRLRGTANEGGTMRWHGIDIYEATDAELERISGMKAPNKVWMLVDRAPEQSLPQLGEGPILVLDHLQDPGNLGTILRTADWFGIRQVVCSPDTASCYNAKVVQASMGGVFRTKICYTNLLPLLDEASSKGLPIYGALLEGKSLFDTHMERNGLLIVGNESKGISSEVASRVTQKITIPNIGGTCESLNAAIATALFCAEWMR